MRFSFFLGEALGSMRRNWVMAMAAVITVFISMAILGAVLATRYNLDQGATSLKNRVLIEVFIKDEVNSDNAKAKQLEAKIRAMPEVRQETVKYVSKDEALQRFEEKFGETITRSLPLNPLPASFEIQVKDPNDVDKVAARFFDDPLVDNDAGTHNGVKYAKETVRKMLGTISLVENGMWVVTVHLLGRGHPAHLHDGAAQHLRPAPRGRDHAPRRRHQLVHPLALRARRLHHRRAGRRACRRPRLDHELGAQELDHRV